MKRKVAKILLYVGLPITYLSSFWLRFVKKSSEGKNILKLNDSIFMKLGILPILDQYYQPLINPSKHLQYSLRNDRNLPGIDLNIDEQLKLLSEFDYNQELLKFPLEKISDTEYYYKNGFYEAGDADYLYNIVRHYKPSRIIEIGSGNSTLMVRNALKENKLSNPNYNCKHICIEPYEMSWLEKIEVELVREKVENIDIDFFQSLQENDILFIDSSHIIRPQGDVLFEFLNVLPTLKKGVIIHVHDIFTPKDYPNEWVINNHLLWNEQYLLEAFLIYNNKFKIIGALNYLKHNHKNELIEKCPVFATQQDKEPSAFWIVSQ